MKLGFVGVGRWAQKLAIAFRACGAEIVAYDRQQRATHEGHDPGVFYATCPVCFSTVQPTPFGSYKPWRDQLTDKSIDAIVAAAPPETTTEVALACAAAGKPVMATKPIWEHPERITAPFYVDFWRLYSDVHSEARRRVAADDRASVMLSLYGNGPFRSFPGAFDWGPHVVAAMIDLLPDAKLTGAAKINVGAGETFRVHIASGRRDVTLYFGNAQEGPTAREYRVGDWTASEEGDRIGNQTKQEVMEAMCRAFMADVAEGYASTRLLELSRESTRLIRRVREMAK